MSPEATVQRLDVSDLIIGFDAMRCPTVLPVEAKFAMPYVAGSSAAHIWNGIELARVRHLPLLPICVPTPGRDNPRQAAAAFAAALDGIGYPRNEYAEGPYPHVLWDLETGKEPDLKWVNIACDYMLSTGRFSVIYGSPFWEFGQPERAGYFVADPTGHPHLYPANGVNGTQFQWGADEGFGRFDRDAVTKSLFAHMGMLKKS